MDTGWLFLSSKNYTTNCLLAKCGSALINQRSGTEAISAFSPLPREKDNCSNPEHRRSNTLPFYFTLLQKNVNRDKVGPTFLMVLHMSYHDMHLLAKQTPLTSPTASLLTTDFALHNELKLHRTRYNCVLHQVHE